MTDYAELVKLLRNCAVNAAPCNDCSLAADYSCSDTLMKKAADAIEELLAWNKADVRGKWKLYGVDKRGRGGIFVCLACEKSFPYKTDFCPNCGAWMCNEEEQT